MTDSQLRSIAVLGAPIAAITICGISMSLTYPLFALRLERMGETGAAIGASATVSAAAMVLGAALMPRILHAIGIGWMMLGALAIMATIFLAIPAWENIWYWSGLRFFYGFAATALFFSSEFWIVGGAPDHLRGRIVGVYAIALSGGFMIGPLMLRVTGYEGWPPILLALAVIALSVLPVLVGLRFGRPRHQPPTAETGGMLTYMRSDPTLMTSIVLFGMIEFGAMALAPVWALRSGLSEGVSLNLLALVAAGSMLAQLPVGWAADRWNRRRMLIGAAALNGAICIALPLSTGAPLLVQGLALLWGASAVTLYSVTLVELGARYRDAALASAMAAVVGCYGLGALTGPGFFGYAMDLVPPDGLLLALLAFTAGYLALAVARAKGRGRDRAKRRSRDPAPGTGPESS